MKALSIQQPFAWQVIYGGKDIENRSKRTRKERETIAIHASATLHQSAKFPRGALQPPDDLEFSAIIGFVDIVGCAENGTKYSKWHDPDCYGWILANPRPLPEPVPCKGSRSFWEIPAHILRRCTEQLEAQPRIRTFRYGSDKKRGEGLRIGTARFQPLRKKKTQWHKYFDLWFRALAPSARLKKRAQTTEMPTRTFYGLYERELMRKVDGKQAIELLAAMSLRTPISVGCYCEDESRCHRTHLKKLIENKARTLRCKP